MTDGPPGTVVLLGVTGSRAYGWETPESDTDRHGVFVMPSERFLGVYPPQQQDFAHRRNLDWLDWEIGHFCRLALKCNPTTLELLFLERHEFVTDFGQELINLRADFLSGPAVVDAFFSYAKSQIDRIRRFKQEGSPEARAHAAKNARHMKRILHQGKELYQTGHLTMNVGDREGYYAFGEAALENTSLLGAELASARRVFESASTPLPLLPNANWVDRWLIRTRVAML